MTLPVPIHVTNALVRKILQQTIGDNIASISVPQLQAFVTAIDALCQSNEMLINIGRSLHGSSLIMIIVDRSMKVVMWNRSASTVTGFLKEEVAGRHLTKEVTGLFSSVSITSVESCFLECLQGKSSSSVMIPFQTKTGGTLKLLCNFVPVMNGQFSNGMMILAFDLRGIGSSASASSAATAETPAMPNATTQPPVYKTASQSRFAGWEEVQDQYAIESVLGQGSYGQVARAKHRKSGEIVAIKKIQNVFADPIDAKRILREMCIVRQLNHPNIVQIREIIRPKDMENFIDLYVVFEFLPTDLEKLLHSPQFLTAEHVRWLLLDLLKAVKYMHSAQIVHRDLKPANVLLNLSPVAIKICDFGLARGIDPAAAERHRKRTATDHSKIESGSGVHPRTPRQKIQRQLTEHVVTRWYRAPEIIFRDQDYSTEIDVWSIGCIFAELLSMQQSSVPSHYQREPLFPGVSCFPLSPGANSPALPQDSRDQLNVILDVLGTMAEDDINDIADPDVRTYLRSISPREKKSLQDMYKGAEKEAVDLLSRMLHMNPRKRITLDEALKHRYLDSIRNLEEQIMAPKPLILEFDEKNLTVPEIRRYIQNEIRYYHPDSTVANNGSVIKKARHQ